MPKIKSIGYYSQRVKTRKVYRLKTLAFSKNWYESIKQINTSSERLQLLDCLFAYAFEGDEDPRMQVSAVRPLWTLIKAGVDANIQKAEGGKKGGRPRKIERKVKNVV